MKTIAIDIGGTTIKGALFLNNNIIKEATKPTMGNTNRETILANIKAVINELFSSDVIGIGISSAGNINPDLGLCTYATDNLKGFTGLNIKKTIEEQYKVECAVENDAICALYGEMINYPTIKNITMLTLGTGVGGAALVDGNILHGSKFTGARFGHLIIEKNGRLCNCGQRGCIEQYISATALIKEAKKHNINVNSAKEVFLLASNGDSKAKVIVDEFLCYLETVLTSINSFISPEVIILGGGVSLANIIKEKNKIENVRFAVFKDKSSLYGANYLINKALEKRV